MNPKYPIYIVSKGRWESRLTSKALEKINVPYNIVIEEQEFDQYASVIDARKILILDKKYQREYNTCDDLGDTKSKGPGPARNFVWDHAIENGAKWHWVMDDNIRCFFRMNHNRRVYVDDGTIFRCMEDFVNRYENVLMAGPRYRAFTPSKQKWNPVVLNTRVYSCSLIRNDAPYRWRARYNEDTDLSLRMLKDDWCTILFCAFIQSKVATQLMKGGNTKEFYEKEGTYPKSQMLVKLHPDVARLKWRYGRVHHYVNYNSFKKNKLRKKRNIKISEGVDNYGMKIYRKKKVTSTSNKIKPKRHTTHLKLDPDPETIRNRELIFNHETTPEPLHALLPKMEKDKKRSFARLRPWAWWTEPVRGCNLRCWHCTTRLFPRGERKYMTMETWKDLIEIIRVVSPVTRLAMANAGEPTLHPKLLDMLAYARERCPGLQMLLYTNGLTLIKGKITYKDMFDAGLNVAYVDMYHSVENHVKLAKETGYQYFVPDGKTRCPINVHEHQGDTDFKAILFSPNPENWPKTKYSLGRFFTFLNSLDWEAASKHGVKPVTEPPRRRCDEPAKFPNIFYDGSYSFCCLDMLLEVAGLLGSVHDGVDGFFRYWFGGYMQQTRKLLIDPEGRKKHTMCKRCNFLSIRCDIRWWPEEYLTHYWTGTKWCKLKGDETELCQPGRFW